MSDSSSEEFSYKVRWIGGGPDTKVPDGGQFDTHTELLDYLGQLDEDLRRGSDGPYDIGEGYRHDGLAVGDAEVYVYVGDPPDLESLDSPGVNTAEAVVKGKIDAAVVLHDGGVEEDKLKDPI